MKLKDSLLNSRFPNPLEADDDGVLCVGGELDWKLLVDAYLHGIFPWPHENYPLLWFCPKDRGILRFKNLHVSHSLKKSIRNSLYRFKLNENFEEIIEGCAKAFRKGQNGTWITEEMKNAYKDLFKNGHVLCLGCYEEGRLVGGLYGVFIAGVFSGESMFGLKSDISKMCVVRLIDILKEKGLSWMDIQMVTPVMESLGGKYISRAQYLELLKNSQNFEDQ